MTFEIDFSMIIICSIVAFIVAGVGMICGFVIGRSHTLSHEPRKLKKDRERTLNSLLNLLDSTQQLNVGVHLHNSELELAKNDLQLMDLEDEENLHHLQERVVDNITKVVQSNRKMEHELIVSQYEMERQAEELDRTRKEARTDSLCNLGNRKAFDEAFQFMFSAVSTP